jgi:hypothetical protein
MAQRHQFDKRRNSAKARLAVLMGVSGLTFITVAISTLPARGDDVSRALQEITDTADRLCGNVATSGQTNSLKASGDVKAELNGLVKKLADIGVSASGETNSSAYEGVVQQELTTALQDVRKCKLKVFNTLQEKLLFNVAPAATSAEEENAYAAARGNLDRLRGYVSTCKVCGHKDAALAEIYSLETTAQEERIYSLARGKVDSLHVYVSTCRVCTYKEAALGEIRSLEAPRTVIRQSSAVLCGRNVDYAVNGTGVAEPYRSFLGVWTGGSWNTRVCGGLIVEGVAADGRAQLAYVYGPNGPQSSFPWRLQRPNGVIQGGELVFQDEDGGRFAFGPAGSDKLLGRFVDLNGNRLNAVFSKDLASVP